VLRQGPKTYTNHWKRKVLSIDRLQPAFMLTDFAEQPVRCAQPMLACGVSRSACNNRRATPASRKCHKSSSVGTHSSNLSSSCVSQNTTNDSSHPSFLPIEFTRIRGHARLADLHISVHNRWIPLSLCNSVSFVLLSTSFRNPQSFLEPRFSFVR